ncbi:MAG: nucleotide exchange factor GrpE [Nitrospiria bacterium]
MTEKDDMKDPITEEVAPEEESSEETPPLSEGEQLQSAFEAQKKAAEEAQARYLRVLADHENYKKRTQKDQLDQIKFANERLVKEILPVIDNLERAIAHSGETQDFEKIVEGVTMIHKQLLTVLDKFGVKPVDCLNQPFDPFHHQSVGQVEIEADSKTQENHVVNEVQKGYFFNEKVLRPSLVMVAKKKQAPTGENEAEPASSN